MKTTIIPILFGRIQSVEIQEGETIETKVARITENKEPITDSAPIIYTEKKDGVLPAYNIRTDRFDIALEAMDKIGRSKAKKENAPKPEDFGNVPNKTEGGTPSDYFKPPIDHLQECNYLMYVLQLSLYARMIEITWGLS